MMFVKTIVALSLAILAIAAPQGVNNGINCTSILYLSPCFCTSLTNLTQLAPLLMFLTAPAMYLPMLPLYMRGPTGVE